MKLLLSLLFAVLATLSTPLHAQDEGLKVDTIAAVDTTSQDTSGVEAVNYRLDSSAYDTVVTRIAQFDRGAIDAYRADPDLDYDRTLHVENTFWDRFLRWLGHLLEKLFGTTSGRWVFGHLYWAVLAFAVILLLIYFRKRLFHGGFSADARRAPQVTVMEEDIARLDLDSSIAAAEREGNWRLAVRYHYLKVLRRLVDEGRIEWQPRSTDRDYLRQLKDPAVRSAFGEVSFLFKWVWYGDAPVDEARYRQLVPAFERFHSPTRASS